MGNETGGSDRTSSIDRNALEKEWANREARLTLSDEDKKLWSSSRYTVRPYVYYDKILIAWHLQNGQPQVKDVLVVTGLDVSFSEGIWVRIKSKITSREVLVRHTPRRLPGLNVFCWVPFFNELRFTSGDWEDVQAKRNLRLSLCFRMPDRPDDNLAEGVDYLSELHVFREKFSQYRDTRF